MKVIVRSAKDLEFPNGSVPVAVAARVMGRDPQYIRAMLCNGVLDIGYATRNGQRIKSINEQNSHSRINYYISPRKFYELTGYKWKGERK